MYETGIEIECVDPHREGCETSGTLTVLFENNNKIVTLQAPLHWKIETFKLPDKRKQGVRFICKNCRKKRKG